jgi:hypothetical protein
MFNYYGDTINTHVYADDKILFETLLQLSLSTRLDN